MKHIRVNVLGLTQAEMAQVAGSNQARVSRWESGTYEPDRSEMARISAYARRRRLRWNDSWFFRQPKSIAA